MADIAGVTQKIQGFLAAAEIRATLEGAGQFSVRNGSTRGFVRAWSQEADDVDAPTYVTITVPLLQGVRDGADLYEYVAFHSDDYIFGHLSLHRSSDGSVQMFFSHELLGDYIDEAEFLRALFGIMDVADNLDDELQSKFGGERFHEN